MMQKAKVISKQKIHTGYVQLYQFDLEAPSLNPQKSTLQLKQREVLITHDSILVLIYNSLKDSFVLCEEFRPGVFLNQNEDNPMILECVSGTIESGDRPEDTAIKETYEETGLRIYSLEPIAVVYKSPGIMTEKVYVYYSEVNEIPQTNIHGVGDEEIRTHVIARNEVYSLMDQMKIIDSTTLLALNWFRTGLP